MHKLFLMTAILSLISAPAWACRGTEEFPETATQIQQSQLPEADKAQMSIELGRGREMHDAAHEANDTEKMGESLRILDSIREKLGQ